MKYTRVATNTGSGLYIDSGDFFSASPAEFTELAGEFCKQAGAISVGYDKVTMQKIGQLMRCRDAEGLFLKMDKDNRLYIRLVTDGEPAETILCFEGNAPTLLELDAPRKRMPVIPNR